MMYETTAKSLTADEFEVTDIGVAVQCLWSLQGVGLFVHQENHEYLLAVVVLCPTAYNHEPVGTNPVAVYKVNGLALKRTAKALKNLAQTIVEMRAAGWDFGKAGYNSSGIDITATHEATSLKIDKNSLPVFFESTVSSVFVNAFNRKLQKTLKTSLNNQATLTPKLSRVDKLKQSMLEEKPSFIHLALRMYPEADTQTLELVAVQAQSLAQDDRSDMIAAIRTAYTQVNEFPLLEANNR